MKYALSQLLRTGALVLLLSFTLAVPAMARQHVRENALSLNCQELHRVNPNAYAPGCGYSPSASALAAERRLYYRPAPIASTPTQRPVVASASVAQPIATAYRVPVSAPVAAPTTPTRTPTSGLYYPEPSGVGDAEVGPAPKTDTWMPYASVRSAQGHTMMEMLNRPVIDEATAKEIVATMGPRLQHYCDEVTACSGRQPAAVPTPVRPSPVVQASMQPTATTPQLNPYQLPENQIVRVGDRQYDKLALYNLVPPLNTISADGPSRENEERITQIALMCAVQHIDVNECGRIQTNYLRTAVPLIAASYDHMEHPQQRYSLDAQGNPVKNAFIYYPQPELPLSSYERAQAWAELQTGKEPQGARTDPRIMQVWREYCGAHACNVSA